MTVPEVLTTGMVGQPVQLQFSPEWEGIRKNAVYSDGSKTVIHTDVECLDTIPAEVLRRPLARLYVSVYGVSADGKRVIPTIRAEGPRILPGAELTDAPGTEPELPVWAQLQQRLEEGTASLNAAMEELSDRMENIHSGADGVTFYPAVSEEGTLSWTNDGELENPPEVNLRGPAGKDGVIALTGASVGQTVKITAVDSKGVPTKWEPASFPQGAAWTKLEKNITISGGTEGLTGSWDLTPKLMGSTDWTEAFVSIRVYGSESGTHRINFCIPDRTQYASSIVISTTMTFLAYHAVRVDDRVYITPYDAKGVKASFSCLDTSGLGMFIHWSTVNAGQSITCLGSIMYR